MGRNSQLLSTNKILQRLLVSRLARNELSTQGIQLRLFVGDNGKAAAASDTSPQAVMSYINQAMLSSWEKRVPFIFSCLEAPLRSTLVQLW